MLGLQVKVNLVTEKNARIAIIFQSACANWASQRWLRQEHAGMNAMWKIWNSELNLWILEWKEITAENSDILGLHSAHFKIL